MKREVLTPSEWSRERAGMDYPPIGRIIFLTATAYFIVVGVLSLCCLML